MTEAGDRAQGSLVQFQKSNESAVGFCHEDDGDLARIIEMLPRFLVVIRQGTWPQGLAQANPICAVTLNNLPDLHLWVVGRASRTPARV